MSGEEKTDELPGAGSPEGQILQDAHAAFERGDYAKVRELTARLSDADAEVANAASALRNRTTADPAQVAIIGACLVFFLFIAWKYAL